MTLDVISYSAAQKAGKRLNYSLKRLSAAKAQDALPSIMVDPPVTAYTAPGGASPINGGSPSIVPWNSPRITVLGARLTKYASAQAGENDNSNAFIPGQYSVEFDYYGSDLAVRVVQRATNQGAVWAWVDGQPVTATGETMTAAASGSMGFYRLTFPTTKLRRIRLYLHYFSLGGIDIAPTDHIAAVRRPLAKVAFYGDSWAEGITGTPTGLEGYCLTAGRMLGMETFLNGQGGTGYVKTNGGRTAYTDAARLTPLLAPAPDLVVVTGTSNDAGQSGVGAAAAAVFAAIAPTPVFVVGPPRQPNSVNNTSNLANRDAIRTAAAAAPNVIGMLDQLDTRDRSLTAALPTAWATGTVYNVGDLVSYADGSGTNVYIVTAAHTAGASFAVSNFKVTAWAFGTGTVGATTGDGSTDLMWQSDQSHLSPAGHQAFGVLVAEAIMRTLNGLALA